MVHSGRDHSHACRGGCGQKTHSSDENVEEIVETNWPVSQGSMQERTGEEITDSTATQFQKRNCQSDPAYLARTNFRTDH